MALPSFFKRKPSPPAPPADLPGDESAAVQQARTRARRRLIGAVVLLAVGVTVFPLVFETRPRPLPADIPIELPRREAAAPRTAPAAPRAPVQAETPVAEPASPVASAPDAERGAALPRPVEPPVEKAPEKAPDKPAAPAADKPVDKVPEKPAERAVDRPADKPVKASEPAARVAQPSGDGERARALLEGRNGGAASDPRAGRFVVQVGAYTDATTLRDVRAKVEKLGLKTYTQSIDTDAGKRTRVRVGPFATRQEADSASAKLKSAGLPGNVLTL